MNAVGDLPHRARAPALLFDGLDMMHGIREQKTSAATVISQSALALVADDRIAAVLPVMQAAGP